MSKCLLLGFFAVSPRGCLKFEQWKVAVFVLDDLGFGGPGIPDPLTELCRPKNAAHMLRNPTKNMRDASPQNICCTERNPLPEKH